uniref:Nuclear nucleic acid-binding protein C1D n=1 Tax=Oryza punctata TaxID=4537 RepID=A0A0E0LT37_ORYPU
MATAAAAAESPSAVPPAVVSAAEDTLAATESVGDHLAELVTAAGEDPDAIAELPPLRRARAFLAMAKAAASLFAGKAALACGLGVRELIRMNTLSRRSFTIAPNHYSEYTGSSKVHRSLIVPFDSCVEVSFAISDQKRSMQAISRGEGGNYSGNKRKPQPPRPNKKSVRAATEEFLAKATLELSGHNDSKVKGPIRLLSDEDED